MVEFSSWVLRLFMMTKTTKTNEMTEASASVALLLATVLYICISRSYDSCYSFTMLIVWLPPLA